jgi:hypothetical protein
VTESTIKKQKKKNYQLQIPTNIILKKLIEKKNKSMIEEQKKRRTRAIIDIVFIKNKKAIFFLSFNFDTFNFNSQQLN